VICSVLQLFEISSSKDSTFRGRFACYLNLMLMQNSSKTLRKVTMNTCLPVLHERIESNELLFPPIQVVAVSVTTFFIDYVSTLVQIVFKDGNSVMPSSRNSEGI